MNKILIGLLALTTSTILYASNKHEFIDVNTIELVPKGCEKVKKCYSSHPIRFNDGKYEWLAPANTETDGATFPEKLEPIIEQIVGYRYDPIIMKAVILHDHYCKKHVRTWFETNRMFYDALIASGVELRRAKLMYAGVLMGSNVWIKKISGIPCGSNCIYSMGASSAETLQLDKGVDTNSEVFITNFKLLEEEILKDDDISLEEIEEKAKKLRPIITDSLNQKTIPLVFPEM